MLLAGWPLFFGQSGDGRDGWVVVGVLNPRLAVPTQDAAKGSAPKTWSRVERPAPKPSNRALEKQFPTLGEPGESPAVVAGRRGRPSWPAVVASRCGRPLWPAVVAGRCGQPLWPAAVASRCGHHLVHSGRMVVVCGEKKKLLYSLKLSFAYRARSKAVTSSVLTHA